MLNDWKPFKVIEAGTFRNNKGEMEKFFYVVLQVPGFQQTMELFEGNQKECEEECNELNQRISASLSLHINENR